MARNIPLLERTPFFGNRTSTKAGGDQNGQNLRSASYTVNNANQYTSRGVPSAFDVVGMANTSASVTVNSAAVDYCRGEYFRKEVDENNSNALVHSYVWGLDLSGSLQGVGGVGGLLMVKDVTLLTHFVAYDFNGNVAGLVSASDGANTARYMFALPLVRARACLRVNGPGHQGDQRPGMVMSLRRAGMKDEAESAQVMPAVLVA